MTNINWSLITNGDIFERLVADLVVSEDPDAHPFYGRKGQDGGMDILSSDGTHVFQAKYRQNKNASEAIKAAEEEWEKIKKYKNKTPRHPREPQWRGVTDWLLVTNVAFNPTNRMKWKDKIVSKFSQLNLKADYWDRTVIESKIRKYPHILQGYFGNVTQAFIFGHRIKDKLLQQESLFKKDDLTPFVGRKKEIEEIESFVNSKSQWILIVHGAAGIGKTRFVYEACQGLTRKGWQVLWANIATMANHNNWFEQMVHEHPTLLIVDAPDNDKVLRILEEQMGNHQVSQWKILITIRSKEHPAFKFLETKSYVHDLLINPLPKEDGELLCHKLISSGPLADKDSCSQSSVSKKLAQSYSYYPFWIILAVHHLESKGNLNDVASFGLPLAMSYFSEIEKSQDNLNQKQVRNLLRWVALLGPVNRNDSHVIGLLTDKAELSEKAVNTSLSQLVKQHILMQRGKFDRLVEMKPDVLRDCLLREWLSTDEGYGKKPIKPSEHMRSITQTLLQATQDGHLNKINISILRSLVRTELTFKLSGKSVDLLGGLINELLTGIEDKSPCHLKAMTKIFEEFASLRPKETVVMSQELRTFFYQERSNDVLFALARPLFKAASGAQTCGEREMILTELCNIALEEAKITEQSSRRRLSDGSHAEDCIIQIISGGPPFGFQFEDATVMVGERLLNAAAVTVPSFAQQRVLKSLMYFSLSRERIYRSYSDHRVQIQRTVINPGHPAWNTLLNLKEKIKKLLENEETPRVNRIILWPFFVRALHSMLQYCGENKTHDEYSQVHNETLEDLKWTNKFFTCHDDDDDLDEISAVKNLWNQYIVFEKDNDRLNELSSLKKLYKNKKLVKEFDTLLLQKSLSSQDLTIEDHRNQVKKKALSLAKKGQVEIEAFLKRANKFFNSDQGVRQLFQVAVQLGSHAESYQEVQRFIKAAFQEVEVTPRTEFAAYAASCWIFNLRKRDTALTCKCVNKLLNGCGSDEQKVYFLMRVYGDIYILNQFIKELSYEEYLLIRSQESLFIEENRYPDFITCIAWGVDFEWNKLSTILERVLDVVPDDQISTALNKLVESLLYALKYRMPKIQKADIPDNLSVWMMDQLIRIPDMEDCEPFLWNIKEVLSITGLVPLSWLLKALETRIAKEKELGYEKMGALSSRIHLGKFVTPVTKDQDITCDLVEFTHQILDLVTRGFGFYFHDLIHEVDPHGRVVPDEVAKYFATEDDKQKKFRLARFCGGLTEGRESWRFHSKVSKTVYSVGSQSWRTIARQVILYASGVNVREKEDFY
ncbi:MAG: ATP-binding protein [Proteobacteria bacterium]|nr:ATP-binding protein [Pseudomonadota bacterium]